MSRCLVKGWVHLESLHLQEAPYSPRQAPPSFHRRLSLHTDHSPWRGRIRLAIIKAAWKAAFKSTPPKGLCTCCSVYAELLIRLRLHFRGPAPSHLPISNVSASLQPPSYTLYHNFLRFFTSTRPYLFAYCNLVESPRERESVEVVTLLLSFSTPCPYTVQWGTLVHGGHSRPCWMNS